MKKEKFSSQQNHQHTHITRGGAAYGRRVRKKELLEKPIFRSELDRKAQKSQKRMKG